jgi:2-methylcitrate dehydratase PrpD
MLHRSGVTDGLARFLVETQWDDTPEPVRHQARRSLLNFFAVALAGCRTEPVEIALRSLDEFSASRHATIIGRSERLDPLGAAFINAASANVFDYCDTHIATVIHPTAPVAPALLALAELRSVSGRELLLALILGIEIECRIGNAISPGHYRRGWHITSTCGVFGAAVGAAKLLRLDRYKTVWTLGNAATQSSGLCECLGTGAKTISVGNAARNGLWSALLADKGLSGPDEPVAGTQGFLNAMGETPAWPALTENLGETWEIMANAFKPYPGGIVMHPVLDAVLDWRRGHPDDAVVRVVVRGNPLLADRTDRPEISTGREAQVSVQHAVAAALVRGKAGLAEFTDTCVRDPAVLALRRTIEVVRDPAIPVAAAAVDLCTSDGQQHRLSVSAARGSAANPMSDRDLEDKLRAIAQDWRPGYDVQPLIDAVWVLEQCEDVASVLAMTAPR